MRLLGLFGIILLVPVISSFGNDASIVKKYTDELRSTPVKDIHLDSIPIDILDQIIAELRKGDYNHRTLLRLGDDGTIEEVIKYYREREGGDRTVNEAILNSASPWMIEELAEFLYVDDGIRPREWTRDMIGWGDWGISHLTAEIIIEITATAPEFSEDTRRSAAMMFSRRPDFVADIITWWEENEAHFENEEYHLVRPVSWDLQEDIEEEDLERDEEVGESESPGDEIPETEERTPEPDSGTREAGEEEQNRTIWLWRIAGIVALVLIAFGAFNLHSRGKSA